jgi:hypothetical protein
MKDVDSCPYLAPASRLRLLDALHGEMLESSNHMRSTGTLQFDNIVGRMQAEGKQVTAGDAYHFQL